MHILVSCTCNSGIARLDKLAGHLTGLLEYLIVLLEYINLLAHNIRRQGTKVGWAHAHPGPPFAMPLSLVVLLSYIY